MEKKFEFNKENVVLKILNKQQKKRVTKDHVTCKLMDLTIGYYYLVAHKDHYTVTHPFTYEMFKKSGLTKKQLHELALKNANICSPVKMKTMDEILEEYREMIQEFGIPFTHHRMLSNDEHVMVYNDNGTGAIAMLYEEILEEIGRIIGGDFVIIPSSDQELIAIAKDSKNVGTWAWSVKTTHECQLDEDIRLSDSIYFYDVTTKNFFYMDIGYYIDKFCCEES